MSNSPKTTNVHPNDQNVYKEEDAININDALIQR